MILLYSFLKVSLVVIIYQFNRYCQELFLSDYYLIYNALKRISIITYRFNQYCVFRIDIHIDVPSLKYRELSDETGGEKSEAIRMRVKKARDIQIERFKKSKIYCNAQMSTKHIKKFCQVDNESKVLLEMAINKMGLSARAYDRILKVSRTIADLSGEENIKTEHVSEAIQYRSLDRENYI